MRRTSSTLIVTVFAAVVAAACSDRAPTPMSPLAPTSAALDRGNPPPPPVTGEAFLDVDIFSSEDASEAMTCFAEQSFSSVAYSYVLNPSDKNAVLHLRIDGKGLDAAVHETAKKLDAHGTITGTGFTFDIKNAIGGSIIDAEQRFPTSVSFQVTGKLTNEFVTCNANANVTVTLQPVIIP